jgi:hypothetical protein
MRAERFVRWISSCWALSGTAGRRDYPPSNISPALANYIQDWGLGRDKWRAFTAAALSLAVRGLLRFDDSSGTLTLKAIGKEAPGRLPVGERVVFYWVNGQGGLAIISDAHGESIATHC